MIWVTIKCEKSVAISNVDVIETISDRITMHLFTTIAKDATNSENLIQLLNICRKQL